MRKTLSSAEKIKEASLSRLKDNHAMFSYIKKPSKKLHDREKAASLTKEGILVTKTLDRPSSVSNTLEQNTNNVPYFYKKL